MASREDVSLAIKMASRPGIAPGATLEKVASRRDRSQSIRARSSRRCPLELVVARRRRPAPAGERAARRAGHHSAISRREASHSLAELYLRNGFVAEEVQRLRVTDEAR
jgi:hypothetical protein